MQCGLTKALVKEVIDAKDSLGNPDPLIIAPENIIMQ